MKTTFDELHTFITIVDSHSVSQAAIRLGISTAAASKLLSRLEAKLDTTLINRTTRRLELSEEGRIFLEQARQIVALVERSEESLLLRRQKPTGLLRINTAEPMMLNMIAPMLPDFCRDYPDIRLELVSDDTLIDLLEERTDIAIRIGALKDSSLHARFLGYIPKKLLASPAYLARHGTPQTPDDLSRHRLLGVVAPDIHNTLPCQTVDGRTIMMGTEIFASGETVRQLILQDMGLAYLSEMMVHQDIAAGRLVPLLENHLHTTAQPVNAVYYRNHAISARISCFLNRLDEYLTQQSWIQKERRNKELTRNMA